MSLKIVEVISVFKSYGSYEALKDTSLHLNFGEFICLIGPSGSGKTTLLQLIAAIIPSDGGVIYRFGEELNYSRKWPNDSRIGYVFQENRLFPHLSVVENCILALEHVKKLSRRVAENRTYEFFEKLNISDISGKFPHQISGGQKQRVAIARTLVLKPKLLLLDEITSSQDPENISNLRLYMNSSG